MKIKFNKKINKKLIKRLCIGLVLALVINLVAGIIYFEIEPKNTAINYNPADPNNYTNTTIQFNSDGKLKIMQVADTHLEFDKNLDASIWVVAEACDIEKPDLVMLTGDNVKNYDDPEQTKKLINALMNVFDSRNIPVAVTFGNHDSESGAMSREDLMAYYNTFSCSVSVDDGEALTGCGTYNIPVLSSDGDKVKFNLWVFDTGTAAEEDPESYDRVHKDQIEWYKQTAAKLKEENNGETVNSLVFQHVIVPEIYDALQKVDSKEPFAIERIYSDGEYYMFDPDATNYGTLNEKPCPGKYNDGQFDALVETGDVLALFSGHDHTNAFGVRYKGIDIYTSPTTRYKGLAYTTQYGYRIVELDENDTSTYKTDVKRLYDVFDHEYARQERKNGDKYSKRISYELAVKGRTQKIFGNLYQSVVEFFYDKQVTYPHN